MFFILITRSLYLKAIRTLHNVIYFDPKKFSTTSPIEVKPVAINTDSDSCLYEKGSFDGYSRLSNVNVSHNANFISGYWSVVSFSSAEGATAADVSPLVLTLME